MKYLVVGKMMIYNEEFDEYVIDVNDDRVYLNGIYDSLEEAQKIAIELNQSEEYFAYMDGEEYKEFVYEYTYPEDPRVKTKDLYWNVIDFCGKPTWIRV